jgi:hypothetical protein
MLSSLIVTISAMKRSALIMQCNLTVDSLTRTSATRSAADMRTKQNKTKQQNKTVAPFSSLLFLSILPTYLPTHLHFSYLPTVLFWPEWANSYHPAFSVSSSHAQVFLPTYLLTYLPTYPALFFSPYLLTVLFWPEWTKSYWPAFCVCKFSCRSIFTYLLFYSGHSEPAVTNLLSVYPKCF